MPVTDTGGCSRSSAARPTTSTGRAGRTSRRSPSPGRSTRPAPATRRAAARSSRAGPRRVTDETAVRAARFCRAGPARLSPAGRRRPSSNPIAGASIDDGPARRARSTPASSGRCSACWRARSSCSASSATRPTSRRARAYRSAISSWRRACRSSSGAAFPDDELLDARGAADSCSDPACSSSRCGGCSPIRESRGARRATSPASGCTCATCAASQPELGRVPGLRRQPAPGVPARDGAVLREHHARGPQRLDLLTRRLHVRQRAAGAALRHPEHLRQPVPPRRRSTDEARKGLLGQGQRPRGDLACRPHVAGVRGKWVLENLLGTAAAAAAARRAAARRTTSEGAEAADAARADGGAPREPGLRELPQGDGSDRLRAGELRRRRRVAHARRRAARSTRRASSPTARRSTASSTLRQALLSAPEMFVATLTEKLLTYALGRGLDTRDMPAVRRDRPAMPRRRTTAFRRSCSASSRARRFRCG